MCNIYVIVLLLVNNINNLQDSLNKRKYLLGTIFIINHAVSLALKEK